LVAVIRAVAFDLDDTLAVTTEDRETLLTEATDRADVSQAFDREAYLEAHREHSGAESRLPVFEALVEENATELTRTYREAISEALVAVDGVEPLLRTLRGRYRVGLLTDGPDTTQRQKLRQLGWLDAFDAVITTGSLDAPKPEPEAFRALASALGIPPEETVYVGDDPHRDVAGAADAGMSPIQVLYDGGPQPHPEAIATIQRRESGSLLALLELLYQNSP
jgi:putative hydrolase of the HAD superfamily